MPSLAKKWQCHKCLANRHRQMSRCRRPHCRHYCYKATQYPIPTATAAAAACRLSPVAGRTRQSLVSLSRVGMCSTSCRTFRANREPRAKPPGSHLPLPPTVTNLHQANQTVTYSVTAHANNLAQAHWLTRGCDTLVTVTVTVRSAWAPPLQTSFNFNCYAPLVK